MLAVLKVIWVIVVLLGTTVALVLVQFRRPRPTGFHRGQLVLHRPSMALCRISTLGNERDGSKWAQVIPLVDADGGLLDRGLYTREPLAVIEPIDIDRAHRIMVRASSSKTT